MDFQSASTERTGADKTGVFGSSVEHGNAESLDSSLTADKKSCEQEPARLRQRWLGKRLGNSVSKPTVKLGLVARIPFYLIASLLSATAMAKVWMLLTDPFADIRVGIPHEVLWITVVLELCLAFENWRIRDIRAMAFLNSIVFGLFASFGGIRWTMGYSSCGCSGNLELPGWMFIIIDVVIVCWFMRSPGQYLQTVSGLGLLRSYWSRKTSGVKGRLAGLVLFCLSVVSMQLPAAAPLRSILLGEPPIGATVTFDGPLTTERELRGTIKITNRSDTSAGIIGVNRSCSCFDFVENPVMKNLAGGESVILPVRIKPKKSGQLHQRVVLFLDHPKQFRLNVDVIKFVSGVK